MDMRRQSNVRRIWTCADNGRLVHFSYSVVIVLGKIHHQKAGNLNSLLVTCQNDSLSLGVVLVEIRPSRVSFNSMASYPRLHAGGGDRAQNLEHFQNKYLIHSHII